MNKKLYLYAVLTSIFLLSSLYFFSSSVFFKKIEFIAFDSFLNMKPSAEISDDVLIISIDEKSLKHFGPWPWPREIIALFISAVNKYSPAFILLDVFFSEELPVIDHFLINAMHQAKNVCLPLAFEQPPYISGTNKNNIESNLTNISGDNILDFHKGIYDESMQLGHGHAIPDIDGVIRRVPLFIKHENDYIPQMALAGICRHLQYDINKAKRYFNTIKIPSVSGKPHLTLPVDKNGQLLINWTEKWKKGFKKISFIDVLYSHEMIQDGQTPAIPLDKILKNKICLIGVTAIGLMDIKPTPVDKNYPMLGVHAHLINSILTDNHIKEPSDTIKFISIFIMPFIISCILFRINKIIKFGFFIFAILLWILSSFFIFIKYNYFMPVMVPVSGIVLCFIINLSLKYIYSLKEAKKLMQQAITDELTGLYSHRFFKFKLQSMISSKEKNQTPFTLLLLDIDNFKNINDNFGHEAGNIVLSGIGKLLLKTGKEHEVINCRYGGEEFCILIVNSNKKEGIDYADKLIKNIRTQVFELPQKKISVTVCIGIVNSGEPFSEPDDFLKAADSAMYHCKKSGKNRIAYYKQEYFMYDNFTTPKLQFDREDMNSMNNPLSLEYISVDLKKRNKELETIIQKMDNMQKVILKHEKESVTRSLTAYISHELNKPIHNIRNSLKILQKKTPNNPDAKEFIDLIYEEINRVLDLSNQMLNFYRPSKQKHKMHNINEILNDILKLSNEQIISRGIFLYTEFDQSIPKTYCSGEELKQVFLNLLINALDALSPSGKLIVTTKNQGEKILIQFKDNGKGIPKEIRENIFKPFFSTKEETGGTGLGLAVSLSIIKRHNGILSFESEEEKGTVFNIEIPVLASFFKTKNV